MASDYLEIRQLLHSNHNADGRMEKLITTLSGSLAEVIYDKSERRSGNYEIRAKERFIHQSGNDFLIFSGLQNLL
jgi:hypothetical protein